MRGGVCYVSDRSCRQGAWDERDRVPLPRVWRADLNTGAFATDDKPSLSSSFLCSCSLRQVQTRPRHRRSARHGHRRTRLEQTERNHERRPRKFLNPGIASNDALRVRPHDVRAQDDRRRPAQARRASALPFLSTLMLTLTLTQGASTTVVGDKMYLFVRPFHLFLGCRCSCSHRAGGSSPSAAWSPTCTSSTSRPSCGRACPRTRTTLSPVRATSTAPTPVSLRSYFVIIIILLFCYRSATFARFIPAPSGHMAHSRTTHDSQPGNGRRG